MPLRLEQGDTLRGKVSREVGSWRALGHPLARRGRAHVEGAGNRCIVGVGVGEADCHLLSPQDVSELCIQLLSQPAAANCTFEVGSSVPFSQPWTGEPAAMHSLHMLLCVVFAAPSTLTLRCPLSPTVDTANPPAPRDWTALVEGAALKQGVTGKTVGGVYTGREPEPDVSVKQGAVNA